MLLIKIHRGKRTSKESKSFPRKANKDTSEQKKQKFENVLVSFGIIFMKSGYYSLLRTEEKNKREREIQVLHDALALTNKLLEN